MNGNSRSAFGSIFGAIVGLMTTLIGLLKTADKGIAMLDVAVSDAAERQDVHSAVDMEAYEQTYVDNAAKKLAEERAAILQYCARSDVHRDGYLAAHEQLSNAVARRKAMRQQKLS